MTIPVEIQKIIQDYIRPIKCKMRVCNKYSNKYNQSYCKECSKIRCYMCNKQLQQPQPLVCFKCAFFND